MLEKSSADSRAPARSAAAHERLVAALSARHPLLEADGFEHHLFRAGDSVLKVYRWFRSGALTLEAERAVREAQVALHRIYAPRLAAGVLALDERGLVCAAGSPRVSCHALSMRLAEPIAADDWQPPADWSRRAGAALAACHRRAPRVSLSAPDAAGALESLLIDAARVYDAERRRFPVAAPLADLVRPHAGPLARGARAASERQVVTCHGDLNTGNLVVREGEVQFIDAGLAMPEGVGLAAEVPFDGGWDLALLGQSVALFGGGAAARELVAAYADEAGVPTTALGADLRYWRSLALLLTLAATMRYSAEIQDPARPFALRRLPGFRLETYVGWLVATLSMVLAASDGDAAANWTPCTEE